MTDWPLGGSDALYWTHPISAFASEALFMEVWIWSDRKWFCGQDFYFKTDKLFMRGRGAGAHPHPRTNKTGLTWQQQCSPSFLSNHRLLSHHSRSGTMALPKWWKEILARLELNEVVVRTVVVGRWIHFKWGKKDAGTWGVDLQGPSLTLKRQTVSVLLSIQGLSQRRLSCCWLPSVSPSQTLQLRSKGGKLTCLSSQDGPDRPLLSLSLLAKAALGI